MESTSLKVETSVYMRPRPLVHRIEQGGDCAIPVKRCLWQFNCQVAYRFRQDSVSFPQYQLPESIACHDSLGNSKHSFMTDRCS